VDAVWCELLTTANSLLTGKRAGNFSALRPMDGKRASKNGGIIRSYEQIPYTMEQGIIFGLSGTFLARSGK
jgi:hypothetical protein